MKCFIHNQIDAIATCTRCGKAMCADCSAYSGHSGVCPECRKEEFIAESNRLKNLIRSRKVKIAGFSILLVVLVAISIAGSVYFRDAKYLFVLIFGLVTIVIIILILGEMKQMQGHRYLLIQEIAKLNKALEVGKAII